jgi:hypothetical protein
MSNTVTKILPESNGSPRLFTIKTSVLPKNPIREKSNLKINSNTAITTILAIIKFLSVTTVIFEKVKKTYCRNC